MMGQNWHSQFVLWAGIILIAFIFISSGKLQNIGSVLWNGA